MQIMKRICTTQERMSQISKSGYAVFMDRDGTLNVDVDYMTRVEDFYFAAGAKDGLVRLFKHGSPLIVVSNQSGVGRGMLSTDDLEKITDHFIVSIENLGASVDAFYYCIHHPGDDCDCRKPRTGMFMEAVRDFNVELSRSFMIGDRKKDIVSASNCGMRKSFLIRNQGNYLNRGQPDCDFNPREYPECSIVHSLDEAVSGIEDLLGVY